MNATVEDISSFTLRCIGKHPEESTVEAKLIMEKAMVKAQRSWLWPVYCKSS